MQKDQTLPIDKDRLFAIIRKWGTPTYVYSEDMMRHRCRTLVQLFPDQPVSWLYAVKANDNPHILRIIAEEGLGFDTVSYEEVLLCIKLGADPQKIFYTENNMTDAEMHGAAQKGVVLNIGSLGRLKAFCEAYPGTDCSIRIKPDIGDGHHAKVDTGREDSKFGIRLDRIAEAVSIAEKHSVRIRGIHAHIGSGIKKPENLLAEIEVLLNACHKFDDVEFINFGGGMPIPYKPDDVPFDLGHFAKLTSDRLNRFLAHERKNVSFLFEPGRWIAGPAGVLLTHVNTVKDQGSKTFLGTDTGFNHLLRPALYDAYHEVVNISSGPDRPMQTYDIAGNICESGDIIAVGRQLPESYPGDYLAILDTGAYGMTMASHYNRRALPAEVLVTREGFHKTIRRRKSAEITVDEFLAETGILDNQKIGGSA
ncbi:MAG: diaminopimelate decarboxylase [Bacteroidota bacterium]